MSETDAEKYPPLTQDIPPDEIVPLNPHLALKDRKNRGIAAVALRVEGANYSQIAQVLEYPSSVAAREAVERTLANSVGDDDREIMRSIESRRLEKVLRAVMRRAVNEDDPEQLNAAKVALMFIDRHIKLQGLDAPQVMAVYSPSATEMQEWLEQASRQIRPTTPQEAELVDGEIVYTDEWEEVEDGS